jgi:exodeoxyribonuclease III
MRARLNVVVQGEKACMRIVTLNLNGIRAAARKGFFAWWGQQNADVLCLQEVRAQLPQLEPEKLYFPEPFYCYYEPAIRPGYSGVAVFSRRRPDKVLRGLSCPEFDSEGRYLELQFGSLSVGSLYLPSGTGSEARQRAKYRFMDHIYDYLRQQSSGRELLVSGDWNIAHRPIDLKNWRGNQKNSGFLPEERAWMDRVLGEAGYVDVFRRLEPGPEHYTWWSNRGRAWQNNVGWRIDYQIATPDLADCARSTFIYKAERFSDHAPLLVEYACAL